MNKHLILFSALLLSCVSSEPNYHYKSVQIDEIMENMDEPTWLLNRMQKSKHPQKSDWLDQLHILQKESHDLIALNHPDKFFQDEAQRVADAIDKFVANLPKMSLQERLDKWTVVKRSCDKCHEVYD